MKITSSKTEDLFIVQIEGEVDASSSIDLDTVLDKALANNELKILVDCEKLSYISSAGLGVFMSYIQDINEKRIGFVLYNVTDKVHNVFRILGLDQLLNFEENKEKAIKKVNELSN